MGEAVGYFPLVGVLIGCLLAGVDRLARLVFTVETSSAIVIAASVVITGALHLDGFLDACDGLLGGRTPESRLRIMRDERVGAFGLAGGVILLLLKYTAISTLSARTTALILAPTLARWAMSGAIVLFRYGRTEGLGRAMNEQAGWSQLGIATGLAFVVSWLAGGTMGLLALALAGMTAWATAVYALRRLPGLTGDLYGAIAELVDLTVLLFLSSGVALDRAL
jgi:adenosylcobinamide-GDP ribazoletransferase